MLRKSFPTIQSFIEYYTMLTLHNWQQLYVIETSRKVYNILRFIPFFNVYLFLRETERERERERKREREKEREREWGRGRETGRDRI